MTFSNNIQVYRTATLMLKRPDLRTEQRSHWLKVRKDCMRHCVTSLGEHGVTN